MELEMIEEATHHQRNWANWYAWMVLTCSDEGGDVGHWQPMQI